MRTQFVDGLLAGLLQDVRFSRVYASQVQRNPDSSFQSRHASIR
jgi:hypothetical protein